MKVVLSKRHEQANCCWCEKERECVTVTFSDGFIKQGSLCWKCLQTAYKVRSLHSGQASSEPESSQA
ncbi:hypothetical protein [Mariniblastus fucicola]|uniref:Uncharacterized protein n=1 Tax=Mariniblastus fucicola TaxID=980251 RepID=A0A5B9P7U8_9BACT|nr:hypothetical protein [Mariniblastus fucicola]QEG21022.1 hypothetical protein MFFC18_08740 [Mariniblastus fucicola]